MDETALGSNTRILQDIIKETWDNRAVRRGTWNKGILSTKRLLFEKSITRSIDGPGCHKYTKRRRSGLTLLSTYLGHGGELPTSTYISKGVASFARANLLTPTEVTRVGLALDVQSSIKGQFGFTLLVGLLI